MRYRAFFSYARADDRVAGWLHRQLDGYRTPKALVGSEGELGPVPAKLHPIFRDRTDLESGGHVDAALQQALVDSETLIVLCTPTSAKSRWVNHECETFLRLGREGAVFPVIASGEPDSSDPETECFPPALRGKGLLAADLREIKLPSGQLVGDGREGARLKLIAGLLGVPLDRLVQRERRRQRQVVAALGAAALTFAGVAAAAGGLGWLAQVRGAQAAKNEQRALKGEADALANAAAERTARDEATRQRNSALASQALAERNAYERDLQVVLANRSAADARAAINRFFVRRAWEKLASDDVISATRYALAGLQASPADPEEYRLVLSAALFAAGESTADQFRASLLRTTSHGLRVLEYSDSTNTLESLDVFSNKRTKFVGLAGPFTMADIAADGQTIATVAGGKLSVWRHGLTHPTVLVEVGDVRSLRFSSDGKRLLTLDKANQTKVWDATTGELDRTISDGRVANSAKFDPAGGRVAIVGSASVFGLSGAGVRIYDRVSGVLLRELGDASSWSRDLAFSPDGRWIAIAYGSPATSGDRDTFVRLYDANSGSLVRTFQGHTDVVRSVEFSPDGSRIVSGSWDGTVRTWDVGSGANVSTLRGHGAGVDSVSYDGSGELVASIDSSGVVRIWPQSEANISKKLPTHRGAVNSVAFDRDGARVISASADGTAKVSSTRTGELLATLGNAEGLDRAQFSNDGNEALLVHTSAAAARYVPATIWDIQSQRRLFSIAGASHVMDAKYSNDGREIVAVSGDGSVKTLNAKGGGEISSVRKDAPGCQDYLLSPMLDYFLCWSIIKPPIAIPTIQAPLVRSFSPFVEDARSVAYNGNGRRVAIGRFDYIDIWDVPTNSRLSSFRGSRGAIQAVALSRTGALVAAGGGDLQVRIWDSKYGVELARLKGHTGSIYGVSFSPDSRLLASGGADRIPRLWNISRLGKALDVQIRDACTNLLQLNARRFSPVEVDSDPLLRSEWPDAMRDVCEGVPGVPSIADLRRRAGFPPEPPVRAP